MGVEAILAIVGGIALLVGIFGGGVKAKEIEIPSIHAGLRVISALTGIALIVIAIFLSRPELLPAIPQTQQQASQPTQQLTAVQQVTQHPIETAIVAASPAPTAAVESTLAVAVPLPTASLPPTAISLQSPAATVPTGQSASSLQAMIDSAQVSFKDNFDNPLFPGWLRWGGDSSTLYIQNGTAFFLSGAQLHRNHGLQENEACLVGLTFSRDGGFMLARTPEGYDSNWRAWGLLYNPDNQSDNRMQDYFQEGIGESAINIYEPFGLQGKPDTSYNVLLWVNGPANFTLRVWDKDNPGVFGEKQFQMSDSENWAGRKWYCNLLVNSGTVQVSSYSELRFAQSP